MSKIKKYLFSILVITFIVFLSVVFINIFYYYNLINENIYRFLKLLSVIVSVFFGGFILGRKSNYKGYLDGLVLGIIMISILFILSILFSGLQVKLLLYYLVILTSSTLGGTIGIRKKRNDN